MRFIESAHQHPPRCAERLQHHRIVNACPVARCQRPAENEDRGSKCQQRRRADGRAELLDQPVHRCQRIANANRRDSGEAVGDLLQDRAVTGNLITRGLLPEGGFLARPVHPKGRHVAWDFAAKFWLMVDGITTGRTDGALVRLTTPIRRGESDADAAGRLDDFLLGVDGVLPKFIPAD